MSDRRSALLETAFRVISERGLRRTTMSDLAQAAGVSRQTLYNLYPNRDEIIRAVLRDQYDQHIAAAKAEWSQNRDLGARLQAFFDHAPFAWFDAMNAAPDAAELSEGVRTAGAEELQQGTLRWHRELAAMLADYPDNLTRAGTDAEALSDFLYTSASVAKYESLSRGDLERRLDLLRRAIVALLAA